MRTRKDHEKHERSKHKPREDHRKRKTMIEVIRSEAEREIRHD